jgi:CysZ protein
MLKALSRGFSQLNDKATRQILWLCIGSAVLIFICLWAGIAVILTHTSFFQWGWLETITDFFGGLATAAITWFLFPGVVSAIIGLFIDRIADCVEAQHYPDLPKANGPPFFDNIISSIKFLGTYVIVNLCLLPFLFLGPLYLPIFYIANGYLISREYFELTAHRHFSITVSRALRKANKWQLLSLGITIAILLTVPIINLITPVIAVGAIIHLSQAWRSE